MDWGVCGSHLLPLTEPLLCAAVLVPLLPILLAPAFLLALPVLSIPAIVCRNGLVIMKCCNSGNFDR